MSCIVLLESKPSFPFKGKVGMGMGHCALARLIVETFSPIPTPALPLKGREKSQGRIDEFNRV